VFIEVSVYEENLQVYLSEMSCATVSSLPWAELELQEEKGASVAKLNLRRSQCQAASRKKSGSKYTGPSHFLPLQAAVAATHDPESSPGTLALPT